MKLSVCVILYKTKYLSQTLPTLLQQDYPDFELLLLDQEEGVWSAADFVEQNFDLDQYPQLKLFRGPNLWHSGGMNVLAAKAQGDLVVVGSNDMLYEKDFLKNLVAGSLKSNTDVFIPLVMRWDYPDHKTEYIDTVGINCDLKLKFSEVLHAQKLSDQVLPEFVDGPNGALFAISRQGLEKLKQLDGFFFDEMIHYKNDCDLAFRCKKHSLQVQVVPTAKAYHDRQVVAHKAKARWVIESSFWGDLCILKKHFSWSNKLYSAWRAALYYALKFSYLLIRYPYLFKSLKKLKTYKKTTTRHNSETALKMQDSQKVLRPKVLLMVLNFFKAKRVLENIADLYKQQGEFELEIVVGDNSCNAEQSQILQALKSYPGLKLKIFKKNWGYIKAHNLMAQNTDADYVFTVNPDILLKDPQTLQKMLDYMQANPDCGVVAPKQIDDDGSITMSVRGWPNLFLQFARRTALRKLPIISKLVAKDEMQDLDYSKTQDVPWLQASFNCVRGDLWRDAGGHDERYFLFMSDPEICWQSWKRGLRVVYHPVTTVYADGIRVSAGGIKKFFKSWVMQQHLKDSLQFMWKHLFEKKPF